MLLFRLIVPEATVKKFLVYLPALIWVGVVLWIGSRTDMPQVRTNLPLDKIAHFGLYGILAALATAGWLRARRPSLAIVLAFCALVGVADELHQRRVQNRSSDVRDWVADVAGIGTAAYVTLRLRKTENHHVV